MKAKALLFGWLMGLAGMALASDTSPIVWEWEAKIVTGEPGGLQPGDAIRGTLTFKRDAPIAYGGGTLTGYDSTLATVEIRGITFKQVSYAGGGWIVTGTEQYGEGLQCFAPDGSVVELGFNFTGGDGVKEPGVGLNGYPGSTLHIKTDTASGEPREANGKFTSLTLKSGETSQGGDPSPVPEPSSLALLASGLAGAGFLRKRG